jgi:hypothetical protein
MFSYLLSERKETLWAYGPVTCELYPLDQIETGLTSAASASAASTTTLSSSSSSTSSSPVSPSSPTASSSAASKRVEGALQVLVDEAHLDLLMHPFLRDLVTTKWNRFAGRIFFRRFMGWLVYLVLLFALVITRQTREEVGAGGAGGGGGLSVSVSGAVESALHPVVEAVSASVSGSVAAAVMAAAAASVSASASAPITSAEAPHPLPQHPHTHSHTLRFTPSAADPNHTASEWWVWRTAFSPYREQWVVGLEAAVALGWAFKCIGFVRDMKVMGPVLYFTAPVHCLLSLCAVGFCIL